MIPRAARSPALAQLPDEPPVVEWDEPVPMLARLTQLIGDGPWQAWRTVIEPAIEGRIR